MCGIAGMFDRESSFEIAKRDFIAKSTEKRGQNGFGVVHIIRHREDLWNPVKIFRSEKTYSELTKATDKICLTTFFICLRPLMTIYTINSLYTCIIYII